MTKKTEETGSRASGIGVMAAIVCMVVVLFLSFGLVPLTGLRLICTTIGLTIGSGALAFLFAGIIIITIESVSEVNDEEDKSGKDDLTLENKG